MTDKTKEAPARSALKLALEALRGCYGYTTGDGVNRTRAITAIREALAEESSGTEQPTHSEAYWKNKITIAYAEGWLKGQGHVKQQPAQQDWKLVPVKPTRDMSNAGGSAVRVCYSNRKGDWKEGEMMCDYIYRKMLNAAPQKEQDK